MALAKMEAVNQATRLKEQAAEFCKTSEQLRARARRLVEEAEHMAQQEARLKTKASAAMTLSSSLEHEMMLLRLWRNDEKTVKVDSRANSPLGHAKALGNALLDNTMVTQLDLDFSTLLAVNDSVDEVGSEMKPLLQYASKSTTLVSFGAHGSQREVSRPIHRASSLLLNSLSKCASLKRLVWSIPIAPCKLQAVLQNCPALVDLDVVFIEALAYQTSELDRVQVAFRSNKTLQRLKLDVMYNQDLFRSVASALLDVTTLLELCLVCSDGYNYYNMDVLAQYLGSTYTLLRLELISFGFTGLSMTQLLSGLRHDTETDDDDDDEYDDHRTPKVFLASLVLHSCTFELGAWAHLSAFLQTRTTNDKGKEAFLESSLRELHLGVGHLSRHNSSLLADCLLTSSNASGDDGNDDNDATFESHDLNLPTIGSQLESLSLVHAHPAFLQRLRGAHPNRVRLQSLGLIGLSDSLCTALHECLPDLTSLHTLKVASIPHSDNTTSASLERIVAGLEKNGSIWHFDASSTTAFAATQRRRMTAYAQRNQQLGTMLGSAVLAGTGSTEGDGDGTANDAVLLPAPEFLVRPALLQASTYVPSTHSTMTLRGVLRLESVQE